MTDKNIAFIGLGVMGGNMARHLAQQAATNGIESLRLYNRDQKKTTAWLEQWSGPVNMENPPLRVTALSDAAQAVAGADVVITCLGNDASLRAVLLGQKDDVLSNTNPPSPTSSTHPLAVMENSVLATMKPGSVLIDHTTASAHLARDIYQLAADRGIDFLDAPVSGGQKGAEQGTLSIMAGGKAAAFERVQPLLGCYGKTMELMGGTGSGQLTKMVNQICIGGLVQALSEALFFGEQAGLDMGRVLHVIQGGAAQSWQMDNRGATMLGRRFDFGFQVKWMIKDLTLCLEEAARQKINLPITHIIDGYYKQVARMADGHGQTWDTSALIKLLDEQSGD